MADIVVKVLADLKALRKDITKSLKEAFKIGVDTDVKGAVAGKAEKEGKKQSNLLLGVITKLAPLGILLTLKPIQQILEITLGILTFGILKILKFFGVFDPKEGTDSITKAIDEMKEGIEKEIDAIHQVRDEVKNLRELLVIKDVLKQIQTGISEGVVLSVEDVKAVLEENGISDSTLLNDMITQLDNLQLAVKSGETTQKEVSEVLGEIIEDELADVDASIVTLKDELAISQEATRKEVEDGLDTLDKSLGKIEAELIGVNSILGLIKTAIEALKGALSFSPTAFIKRMFGREEVVGDAIIKPDGTIIRTDPNDTLIATQNPENLGGGKTIIINAPGMDEVINIVRREFGADILKTGRF